jgi:putative SOS response-associated peptidase YedK
MCFSVAIERNLSVLGQIFDAKVNGKSFEQFLKLSHENPQKFRAPDEDNRIYPNSFAPVVHNISVKGKETRLITPMRYRVRPYDSKEEVPSKFNLFNARLDSLEKRKTWRPLFGQNHGLFPLTSFFEWVERPKGKQLVRFKAQGHEHLWAPALFDYYQDGQESFYSFALITTDPPAEILEAGHDRCPIFLKKEYWQDWLSPRSKSKDELYSLLNDSQVATYEVFDEESPQRASMKSPASVAQLDLFGN